MDQVLFGDPPPPLSKFKVIGYIASPAFQKCSYYVTRLHQYFPKMYAEPDIRAMFDLDWEYYITKMRRRHGTKYYLLQKRVAVHLDEELLGDDADFMKHISEKYYIDIDMDFDDVCTQELIAFFSNVIDVQMLYNDLVPTVCENFFARCKSRKEGETYKNTPIHRVVPNGWIQCGGFKLHQVKMPCENYVVPHDRKGVLSMCNQFRHVDNSTQFVVTLDAAPFMDYKYVAFGQLLHGVDVLNALGNLPTYYQSPKLPVEIIACGEYSLCPAGDAATGDGDEVLGGAELDVTAFMSSHLGSADAIDFHDTQSVTDLAKHKAGKYSLWSDLKSYFPFMDFYKEWMKYLDSDMDVLEDVGEDQDGDKSGRISVPKTPSTPEFTIQDHFYV